MIKRFIASLTICLIITGLISPVFSHAEPIPIYTPNWNDPGIAEIINISDLTGWMANGGVYDITSFQNLDEFLTWYFKIRVPIQDEDGNITFAPTYGYDTYLDSNYTSPRFIEQSNIRGMISRSYKNKTGYGRRLQDQVDKALLEDGDLSNINIPLLNTAEAAYFIGHNTNAIDFYRDIFEAANPPSPEPPEIYNFLLNSVDFNWGSTQNLTYDSGLPLWYNVSSWPNNPVNIENTSFYYFGNIPSTHNAFSQSSLYNFNLSSTISIYINDPGDNSPVTCTYSGINPYWSPNNNTYYVGFITPNNINNNRLAASNYDWKSNNNWFTNLQYSFAGLGTCVNYIYQRFRHVNIYYNNEPWVIINDNSNPGTTPEFPNVVGGDELPTTTWPLTVPKAPSYINLPGLRQAFQRAKNTDNQFDIMDLKDSLVDPEGDPIIDPEMETVPIPLPNPDPINPEVVPELPDLPLIPPSNNPGFSGVSVLAEIINFTNQSLPSALITVFWGIVFGAVILGIIKILHK